MWVVTIQRITVMPNPTLSRKGAKILIKKNYHVLFHWDGHAKAMPKDADASLNSKLLTASAASIKP